MKRLVFALFNHDTVMVRFWFSIAAICAALDQAVDTIEAKDLIMQSLGPHLMWALLFAINASALMYGVITHKFNKVLLVAEGVLGAALWIAMAMAHIIVAGTCDVTAANALVAVWLLIRYPTHRKILNAK